MLTGQKKLITHNGSFHADDVFAAAALSLFLKKSGEKFDIIRTRDPLIIERGDYVFDVGGVYDEKENRFDHHQKGGAGIRENDIEYASFGLVWKKFGADLAGGEKSAKIIDDRLVAPVDAWDNGFDLVENKYDISPYFIQHAYLSMLPTWRENEQGESLLEMMFLKSVAMAREILTREIIQVEDAVSAEERVIEIYKNTKDKRIIVLDKHYPYESILHDFPEPLFVVYPRGSAVEDDSTWGAKAVRENSKTFKNKKDFPKTWAGLRDEELVNITGVRDAVFCHRSLFLVVTKSKEGAIKLAELALRNDLAPKA